MRIENVLLSQVQAPEKDCTLTPVILSDETMILRKEKILRRMAEEKLDAILVYADLEHGNNFEYLTGFVPRFEEALLVLHGDGEAYILLGNENLNKAKHARIPAKAIHTPHFSLPNQPMKTKATLETILAETKLSSANKIGLVGWKLFTCRTGDNSRTFDLPHYIVSAVMNLTGEEAVCNATKIFIGNNGARTVCKADEIAHYEFGASLASDCVLDAMDAVAVGVSEMELGDKLSRYGQYNSVITIAAAGERFEKAYLYPRHKKIRLGDKISLTAGYKGGLSSRIGYCVHNEDEMPGEIKNYVDVVVKPYYNAICAWLENMKCGMRGKEIYDLIENILPKAQYHWELCPGHLVADEEWMASPIYENSGELLQSGMLFQTDIIPSVPGYGGASAESTVCLADETLREAIKAQNPALWQRFQARRNYLTSELNINLSEDILPMCSTVAYMRPYLLDQGTAMKLSGDRWKSCVTKDMNTSLVNY